MWDFEGRAELCDEERHRLLSLILSIVAVRCPSRVNNGRFWPSLKVSALPREQT
jgi:hypothetical protein